MHLDSLLLEILNLILYHAIENTANQNTGKQLYIQRYYTQPSHRALRVSRVLEFQTQ